MQVRSSLPCGRAVIDADVVGSVFEFFLMAVLALSSGPSRSTRSSVVRLKNEST